jgi:hypothetical protein
MVTFVKMIDNNNNRLVLPATMKSIFGSIQENGEIS